MLEKGYTHLYTGNGKGKTTAALGLALRAYGAGLKTLIIQFMKNSSCSEHSALNELKKFIKIKQFGSKSFYNPKDGKYIEHRGFSSKALSCAKEALNTTKYSVIILDEIVSALSFDLVTLEEIFEIIDLKPKNCELILTGQKAPDALIEKCDLVTEMKKIKHYYDQGVLARKGIEK